MKNKCILLLLSVVLLSSCAGKFGVMKRRYNKGYYVSVTRDAKSASPTQQATKASVKAKALPAKQSVAATEVVKPEPVKPALQPLAVEQKQDFRAPVQAKKLKTAEPGKVLTAASARSVYKLRKTIRPLADELKSQRADAKEESGTPKIVLIILALFPILSLIAVYLHDGGITTNFWVTLLLHFLLLYWLFALLVVLDVVDLG